MLAKQLQLTLVALALVCYLPFLGNKLVWDDEQFIYSNAHVRNFAVGKIFTTSTTDGAGIISNYYRPFTTLSFAIDQQFWGLNPVGYHLPNMLLHLGSGLLLFYLLYLIGLSRNVSFWISALFIIHPIQTEAVVYANSRGDSLYTFFAILALTSFLYAYKQKSLALRFYEQRFVIKPLIFAIATPLLYLSSILSKEIGIATLGLFGLVYLQQILTNQKKHAFRKIDIAVLVGVGVIAGVYLWLRGSVLNFDNSYNFYSNASLYGSSIVVRLLTFSKVIWIYFQLLLAPFPLHMERDIELVTTLRSIFPWATLALVTALSWLGWREYKNSRQVWIWLGVGWFFGMLAPVSGIIPINGILYEHWLYVPMIGFFICIFGLLKNSKKYFKSSEKYVHIILSIFAAILIILTLRQNYIWGSPIRFYSHLLQYTESARIHNNVAMAYADEQELEKALEHYERSLEIAQVYPQTYYNMANLYIAMGKYEEAIPLLEKALELAPEFGLAEQKLNALHSR
ncbi:MAG: tetratricopeptide repeat protein [bacterium]|nr:tetratricopeptide repeat protein [bacterium]